MIDVSTCLVLAALAIPASAAVVEPQWITAPVELERTIEPRQEHSYQLLLPAGETLRGYVDQGSSEMSVAVIRSSDGAVLLSVANARAGRDRFVIPADSTADVRIVIRQGAGSSHYTLHVSPIAPTTDRDRLEAEAERLIATTPNASEPMNKALALCQSAHAVECEADAWHGLALSFWYNGVGFREGCDLLEKSVSLWRQTEDRLAERDALNDLAILQHATGDALAARESCKAAMSVQGPRHVESESLLLHNCAPIHWELGEWQTALDQESIALDLFRKSGHQGAIAYALTLLGDFERQLGDTAGALRHQQEALEIWSKLDHTTGRSVSTLRIGILREEENDRAAALEHYRKARELARVAEDEILSAQVLLRIAGALLSSGDPVEARKAYEEALEIFRRANIEEAAALRGLGDVAAASGRASEARDWYARALAAVRSGDQTRLDIELAMIRLERNAGNLERARALLEEATSTLEVLRARVANPEVRASFLAAQQTHFDLLIDVLMRLHRRTGRAELMRAAFETSEQARARGLLDSIAAAGVRDRSVDPRLAALEEETRQKLNGRAAALARLKSADYDGARGIGLRAEIADLLKDHERLRTEMLRSKGSEPRDSMSLGEIQKLLDGSTVLLEYALGPDRSYLWVVTKRSIAAHQLPSRSTIEKLVRRVVDLVPKSYRRDTVTQAALATARLSDVILKPAMARLDGKRLAIVADGALQFVPFAALPLPGTNDPLIRAHELVVLPSASVMAALRERPRKTVQGELAMIADPVVSAKDLRFSGHIQSSASTAELVRSAADFGAGELERLPFARTEADRISALFPSSKQVRALGFHATREIATSGVLERYRQLHFATHGLINSVHPELSGLVLSLYREDGRPQDGFLRLADIYNLHLNADLVVISACRTALGRDVKREGLIGLTRGFMHAGAPRVVASLWDVRDSATAELMERFYKHMTHDRMRPAAALRAAQLSMVEDPRWKAPFYWAAFELHGEWR